MQLYRLISTFPQKVDLYCRSNSDPQPRAISPSFSILSNEAECFGLRRGPVRIVASHNQIPEDFCPVNIQQTLAVTESVHTLLNSLVFPEADEPEVVGSEDSGLGADSLCSDLSSSSAEESVDDTLIEQVPTIVELLSSDD